MLRTRSTVVIDRPIEDVWAFIVDPFNMPRASRSWLGTRMTSSGPLGLGSTFHARWTIFGFETRTNFVVTEWDPPRRVTLSGTGGPMRSGTLGMTLESTAQGTRIVRTSELEPRMLGPLWAVAWPFIRRVGPRTDRKMKEILESGRR